MGGYANAKVDEKANIERENYERLDAERAREVSETYNRLLTVVDTFVKSAAAKISEFIPADEQVS